MLFINISLNLKTQRCNFKLLLPDTLLEKKPKKFGEIKGPLLFGNVLLLMNKNLKAL